MVYIQFTLKNHNTPSAQTVHRLNQLPPLLITILSLVSKKWAVCSPSNRKGAKRDQKVVVWHGLEAGSKNKIRHCVPNTSVGDSKCKLPRQIPLWLVHVTYCICRSIYPPLLTNRHFGRTKGLAISVHADIKRCCEDKWGGTDKECDCIKAGVQLPSRIQHPWDIKCRREMLDVSPITSERTHSQVTVCKKQEG